MASFITLKGIQIQVIAGDPANPVEGQIWYNYTTGLLKFYNGSGTETVTSS